jgi:hypothetical protein
MTTFDQKTKGLPVTSNVEPERPEKTTDLSQVTDKLLSHNVVSNTPSDEWDSNSQLIV